MQRFLVISILAAAASTLAAQRTDSVPNIVNDLNQSGKFTIEQPETMLPKLERGNEARQSEDASSTNSHATRKMGYRVEVFADNNVRTAKAAASSRRRQLSSRFPQYKVYLVFDSPFWRVRLGDFTNRAQAEGALQEVRKALPSLNKDLRIVRSAITPN